MIRRWLRDLVEVLRHSSDVEPITWWSLQLAVMGLVFEIAGLVLVCVARGPRTFRAAALFVLWGWLALAGAKLAAWWRDR